MMATQLSSAASMRTSMRSAFCGVQVRRTPFTAAPVSRVAINIDAAHKMGSGSTKNGRDSNSKRRGIKVYGGQPVKAGGIIVRQVGSTWYPGTNVAMGKDYTIFSTVPGLVRYEEKHDFKQVSVYPFDSEMAQQMVAKTHTTQPKEGVPSRKERRKAAYKPRAEQRNQGSTVTVAVAAVRMAP